MNNSNLKGFVLVICLASSLMGGTSAVQAFDGYWNQNFPWFGYGNNGPAAYSLGNIPAPPYFALHPPVYYSHPRPRTYGHSPFASSCNCHEIGGRIAAARVVVNPHIQVKPANPPASPAEKPVKIAERIANPFFAKSHVVLAGGEE